MPVRVNIPATEAASVSRGQINLNTGRANWHNVLVVTDEVVTISAGAENPETLYDAVEGTASADAAEIELPPIDTAEDGRVIWIHVDDADGVNTFTVTPGASDTIGGASSYVFTAAGSIGIRASNAATDWRVFMTSA